MEIYERVLLYITAALIALALLFGVSAVFVDDFRIEGATIAGVILGALTTMVSVLAGGNYITREVRKRNGRKNGNNSEDGNGS